MIDGYTRMAAVVARPIQHSLSPLIHNLAFDMTGVNGAYLAWDIGEKDLAESLENIRRYKMFGLNVSMPYKESVIPYLDALDPIAQQIGAVNTIVREGESLVGYNTDGLGFWRSLSDSLDFDGRQKKLLVIGTGATARAIMAQAAPHGLKEIVSFTKGKYLEQSRESLAFLSRQKGLSLSILPLEDEIQLLAALSRADILVNASSIGMDGVSLPLPCNLKFPSDLLVADVIYQPFETPLLALARQEGLKTLNGLGMLLYQAAESFRLWTGHEMPAAEIWPILLKHVRERS